MADSSDSSFTFRMMFFSVTILLLFPMLLGIFVPQVYSADTQDELMDGYTRMTGQAADTKVSVWPLSMIATPFTGGFVDEDTDQTITYGYSEDGWLYGTSVQSYSPSQYLDTSQKYTVYRDDSGVFRYWQDSKDYNKEFGTGHKGHWGVATQEDVDAGDAAQVGDLFERKNFAGDLYTEVNFDASQKSDIFFVESSRQEDKNGHFKYDYSGYRYAFSPIASYTAVNADGEKIAVKATTTSLSLVWYQYYSQSGITGQLVLSGSNGGIAYLNAAQILGAFNNTTSTAVFDMVFNGVTMTIYIKIDPMMATTGGYDVETCYNMGYWSIMVTSLSVDSSAYTGTDFASNPMQLVTTMIDLFTFNLDDYNMAPWLANLCSFFFVVPLYLTLVTVLLSKGIKVWIGVGILAAIQAISSIASLWPF